LEGARPPGAGTAWVRNVDGFAIPPGFRKRIATGELEEELERLRHAGLSTKTHVRFNQDLLWAEEVQLLVDIRQFDMAGARLQVEGRRYGLAVPGLAESRPSVLKGDKVIVTLRGRRFKGYAWGIERDQVILDFHREFNYQYGDTVDVEFTFPRTMLRLEHNAVCEGNKAGDAVLYPQASLIPATSRCVVPCTWANPPAAVVFSVPVPTVCLGLSHTDTHR
jgi:helicase MOV-10